MMKMSPRELQIAPEYQRNFPALGLTVLSDLYRNVLLFAPVKEFAFNLEAYSDVLKKFPNIRLV